MAKAIPSFTHMALVAL